MTIANGDHFDTHAPPMGGTDDDSSGSSSDHPWIRGAKSGRSEGVSFPCGGPPRIIGSEAAMTSMTPSKPGTTLRHSPAL
jgi:hypothetical protein